MSNHRPLLAVTVTLAALFAGFVAPAAPATAETTPPRPACAVRNPILIGSSGMVRSWGDVLLVDAGDRCQFRGTVYASYWKDEEIHTTVRRDYVFWAEYELRRGQWVLVGISN